ncbi:MAG: hypothetical protein ACE5I7_05480 [Candidatus Binatia bacterium]
MTTASRSQPPDHCDHCEARQKELERAVAKLVVHQRALTRTVHACEERLKAFAARLNADEPTEAAERAKSTHALARADQALRRVAELAAAHEQGRNLSARHARDYDALSAALQRLERQLTATRMRLDAALGSSIQTIDKGSAPSRAEVDELRRLIQRVLADQQRARAALRIVVRKSWGIGQRFTMAWERFRLTLDRAIRKWPVATDRALRKPPEGLAETRTPSPTSGALDSWRGPILVGLGLGLVILVLAIFRAVQWQGTPTRGPTAPALYKPAEPVIESQGGAGEQPGQPHARVPLAPPRAISLLEGPADEHAALPSHNQLAQAAGVQAQEASEPAQPVATLGASAPPPWTLYSLEPEGATACVVAAAHDRVCVYVRAPAETVAGSCYPIVAAQLHAWPQWLIAAEVSPTRIRLVDEKRRARLQVVPDTEPLGDAVVQLRQQDFGALSVHVAPWRTTWVSTGSQAAGNGTAAAAARLRDTLERWRQAWEGKRFKDYMAFYHPKFAPQKDPDRRHWQARKRRLFRRRAAIKVRLSPASIVLADRGTTAFTDFEQLYHSGNLESEATKVLRWHWNGRRWTITTETVLRESQHR